MSVVDFLEGSHLTPKELLVLAYYWAHDCAGLRAENMLGHSPTTVASWSARFRQCVLNQQDATVDVLGGHNLEVEADESELGVSTSVMATFSDFGIFYCLIGGLGTFFLSPRTRYSSRRGLEGVKQEGVRGGTVGSPRELAYYR